MKITLDWQFFIALLPYILYGPVSRVLEDADYFMEPFEYWYISPLIYLQIAVFALSFVFIGYFSFRQSHQKCGSYCMIGATVIIYLMYLSVWIIGVEYGAYIIHPLVMGVHRNGKRLLGTLLPDYILIQDLFDLRRCGNLRNRLLDFALLVFGEDFVTKRDALIADIHGGSGDEFPDSILGFSTERTAQMLILRHETYGYFCIVCVSRVTSSRRLRL